jgi:hypothetical protein
MAMTGQTTETTMPAIAPVLKPPLLLPSGVGAGVEVKLGDGVLPDTRLVGSALAIVVVCRVGAVVVGSSVVVAAPGVMTCKRPRSSVVQSYMIGGAPVQVLSE